jgi:ESCRT-II complex subunit VPS36
LQALRQSGEKLAKLAAELSAKTSAGQGGEGMDAGMARELIDLGFVSPVTKQSAGKQYHQQLSRQLAEFLEKNLRREKGMMVLHDVYCLFNRCASSFSRTGVNWWNSNSEVQ